MAHVPVVDGAALWFLYLGFRNDLSAENVSQKRYEARRFLDDRHEFNQFNKVPTFVFCSDFGVVFLTFWLFGQAMVSSI